MLVKRHKSEHARPHVCLSRSAHAPPPLPPLACACHSTALRFTCSAWLVTVPQPVNVYIFRGSSVRHLLVAGAPICCIFLPTGTTSAKATAALL